MNFRMILAAQNVHHSGGSAGFRPTDVNNYDVFQRCKLSSGHWSILAGYAPAKKNDSTKFNEKPTLLLESAARLKYCHKNSKDPKRSDDTKNLSLRKVLLDSDPPLVSKPTNGDNAADFKILRMNFVFESGE